MKKILFIVFLIMSMASCTSTQSTPAIKVTDAQNTAVAAAWTDVALTQMALPALTPTVVVIPPTPLPTQPAFAPFLTPDAIQVERWQEYQTELARALFSLKYLQRTYDPEEYKNAACEWDILGRSGQEVYAWVGCLPVNGLDLRQMPTVIYLKSDGSIREVKVFEKEYPLQSQAPVYDLQLFPIKVQEKLCLEYFEGFVPQCGSIIPTYNNYTAYSTYAEKPKLNALETHLDHRAGYPGEPPLIILLAMPATIPTP